MRLSDLSQILFRKKTVGPEFFQSSLNRCMNVLDVTFLGTGHIIGAGVWVMSGSILHNTGPGIVLSYVFSGILAILAALLYAEFGGRIPKAGSVYSYGYITLGEFWAFLVGWDLLLENILGAAALAVAWSKHLDTLLPNAKPAVIDVQTTINGTPPIFSSVDYVAAALIITICTFISLGVKFSTVFNNIFNIINLSIVGITVAFGLSFANTKLWTDVNYVRQKCPNESILQTYNDNNGTVTAFLPYGVSSVFTASVSVYFAYIGFETMTSAGEEVKHPHKTLPLGIILAITIVTVCYLSMTITLSLMVPFCDATSAPFAYFFKSQGYAWAHYLSSAGALCAMTSVLYGFLFCLPRGVYAMASDGLLFKWLAYIHPRTKVPIVAVVVFGLLSVLPALFLTLEFLTEMVSIGTLTAYNVMACSVIILRYRQDSSGICTKMTLDDEHHVGLLKTKFSWLKPLFGSFTPGVAVGWLTATMIPFMIGFSALVRFGKYDNLGHALIPLYILCSLGILVCIFFIFAHQQSNVDTLYFKVPLVPFIPTLSLFLNIIFMMNFPPVTWLRLVVWLVFGISIYLAYGVYHSRENKQIMGISSISRNSSRRPVIQYVK